MGAESKIQWTHHTFNPWWGCFKVSPGCKNCYAEAFARRVGFKVWGTGDTPRRLFEDKHWSQPLTWARAAWKAGERHRVFCASMADVFEDHPATPALESERQKLWKLIRATFGPCAHPMHDEHCDCGHCPVDGQWRRGVPGLDWLLLTKRPENVLRMAPADILPLVWVGTTVEDQERADQRIPELLRIPARVRFLSCEPLLGPVTLPRFCACGCGLTDRAALRERMNGPAALNAEQAEDGMRTTLGVDWVIVGGESGPGARPFDLAWARSIVAQCRGADVPTFVKQLGAYPVAGRVGDVGIAITDRKGGDPSEWPEDLRVRQFPEVRHG